MPRGGGHGQRGKPMMFLLLELIGMSPEDVFLVD